MRHPRGLGRWRVVALAGVIGALPAGCGSTPATTTTVTPGVTVASPTWSPAPSPTTGGEAPHTSGVLAPPFVSSVRWVDASGGRSLRVVPTAAGRVTQGVADGDEAWAEVLRLAPDADAPGMRAQFDCHWQFARVVAPDKPSWNLEPWRPVVSWRQLVDTGCNPGGPESAET